MGLTDSIIETGVDKLVKLVNLKGKVSPYDAAKELGISSSIVMEWADFLEEEGIINIEYKFTKPFLIARKMGKKEVQEKAKEFSGKKDIFVRKAEVSLSFLSREAEKLNTIKDEFDKIEKELGFDLSNVKNELEELEKYEHLKMNLDKQIENQRKTSVDRIKLMSRQISMEKKKYEHILGDIKKEGKELEKEKKEILSLEESENLIKLKVDSIKDAIKGVEKRIKEDGIDVRGSKLHIGRLASMAEGIKANVQKEKESIEPLIKKSIEQSNKIKELQKKIISKIEEKEKKLKGAKKASKRIRGLFRKKADIMAFIEKINKDRNDLEKYLVELVKKAKSFQLSSKKKDIGSQMVDMEKKFKDVDQKKKVFETELKKLFTVMK